MSFIESYKHLEKLCSEIMNDDRRVSAYIDEMINTPRGSYFVRGWDNDLKQLKHYRWLRNQIVHEPDCNEQNMCEPGDIDWIDDFYSRIMNQTDPLALYAKATASKPTKKVTHISKAESATYSYPRQAANSKKTPRKAMGFISFIGIIILIVAIIFIILKSF